MCARRGIALVTVVLLSALILITIVGVGSVLVQEKIMVTSEHGFKDALAVAEAGMAQATANMRNAHEVTGGWADPISDEIFTAAKIEDIATETDVVTTVWSDVFPPDTSPPPKISTVLRLKVKNLGGSIADGTLQIRVMSMGEKYVSPLAASTPSETALIGRRVLQADYQFVRYTDTIPHYAMYAGAQIDFKGNNSHVYDGDIFANGDINLQKKGPRLDSPYTVYSAGTVSNAATGEIVHDGGDGQAPITLVPPTLVSMQQLAYEFRTGTGPYAVIKPTPSDDPDKYIDYPSTDKLTGYLDDFLGAFPASKDAMVPSTLTGVSDLIADLMDSDGVWSHLPTLGGVLNEAIALRTEVGGLFPNLSMSTYYVETDKNLTVGTLSALGTIAVLPELSGGKRELKIAGGADVGAWPYAASGFSMVVYGDIVGTGNNNTNGRFTGQITATGDFSGGGNYTVNGQIIVGGSITVEGDFHLHYVEPTGGTAPSSRLEFVLKDKTWHEETLDKFTSFN